jgi:hypothetical protein
MLLRIMGDVGFEPTTKRNLIFKIKQVNIFLMGLTGFEPVTRRFKFV